MSLDIDTKLTHFTLFSQTMLYTIRRWEDQEELQQWISVVICVMNLDILLHQTENFHQYQELVTIHATESSVELS